jgi:tetratricopeptide (TPR) repeat protein
MEKLLMVSEEVPKLLVVCFQSIRHTSTDTSLSNLLQHFQNLYVYGILAQMTRMEGFVTAKDRALKADKIELLETAMFSGSDMGRDMESNRERYQKLCQSNRTQYLLAGKLIENIKQPGSVSVHLQLYNATQNQFCIDHIIVNTLTLYHPAESTKLVLNIEALNLLVNKTVSQCLTHVGLPPKNREVLTLQPVCNTLEGYQQLLTAYCETETDKKIRHYEQVLRDSNSLDIVYYYLAKLHKRSQQHQKSILYFREALKYSMACNRTKSMLATEAGIACMTLDKADLALKWWLRAIQYDESYILPYLNVANVYEDQNNLPEAEQYFCKAQALSPGDFRTIFNLARLYSKMGFWEKALGQYLLQLESEGTDPWCCSDIAMCYLNLGDTANAKNYLEETLKHASEGEAAEYAQLVLMGLQ